MDRFISFDVLMMMSWWCCCCCCLLRLYVWGGWCFVWSAIFLGLFLKLKGDKEIFFFFGFIFFSLSGSVKTNCSSMTVQISFTWMVHWIGLIYFFSIWIYFFVDGLWRLDIVDLNWKRRELILWSFDTKICVIFFSFTQISLRFLCDVLVRPSW